MTWMTLTGIGIGMEVGDASSSAAANPQLQFFENFPGHLGAGTIDDSGGIISLHAVNIPLSISLNTVIFLLTVTSAANSTRSMTYNFGLYSLNGSTLSLANKVSRTLTYGDATFSSWISMTAVSSAQNITPGTWYFGFNKTSAGNAVDDRYYGNSSINPGNAIPGGFLRGRNTVATADMPASIATSDLDITGSDATRQPYIIITA